MKGPKSTIRRSSNGALTTSSARWPKNVIAKCNIVLGLAIVENQLEQTALIQAVRPEEFLEREIELLKLAKQWLPRIPYPDIDLLIIDEIGKNISGNGHGLQRHRTEVSRTLRRAG